MYNSSVWALRALVDEPRAAKMFSNTSRPYAHSKIQGFVAKMLTCAMLVVLVCGCASTVQVSARFPAKNPAAAELRKIAVSGFQGPDGDRFAVAMESELASAQFDRAQYFTVVDSGTHGAPDARSAAAYGRSVGAQGVYFGQIQTESLNNQSYQGFGTACARQDQNGNCTKYKVVQVPCTKRVLELSVVPQLVKVATGQVVYSSRKSASAETSWCEGDSQSTSDEALVDAARNNVLASIRNDVAPYNATLQATLKESSEGLSKDAASEFASALQFAKKGDMGEACNEWADVDKNSPDHAWTVYDLGVCAEATGDYLGALNQYERARTLSPKADGDITASITRAQQLVQANRELAAEQRKRELAEQRSARKQQAQARAAELAQDARHAHLVARFGPSVATAVEAGQVVVGMTTDAVLAAMRGPATRRELFPPDMELWHYGSTEIAFRKGRVTHIGH